MPFNRRTKIRQFIEVVLKKKQMKIVKFGGKSLANGEGINNSCNIIEGKIKQEEKSLSWFQQEGKQLMSWTIFLLAKMEITNHFREFKTYKRRF
jgi:hypothetical protein